MDWEPTQRIGGEAEMSMNLRRGTPADAPRLKAGVIGPWGLAALVIGVTSPAIGLYATWGPIEATAGPVAPLVFLAALIIILPTVLSYASLDFPGFGGHVKLTASRAQRKANADETEH
jgi:hypothetical protein